jgi:hypothetical protein
MSAVGDARKRTTDTPTDATQAGRDALNAAADYLDKLNNTGGMVAFLRVFAGGYRAGGDK